MCSSLSIDSPYFFLTFHETIKAINLNGSFQRVSSLQVRIGGSLTLQQYSNDRSSNYFDTNEDTGESQLGTDYNFVAATLMNCEVIISSNKEFCLGPTTKQKTPESNMGRD